MKQFHPDIIQIKTAYVNSYLFRNGKNSILVDSGKERSGKKVLRAISKAGLLPEDIRLIIFTHPHYDHCMGYRAIQSATGAEVIVQRNDESSYRKGWCRLPRGKNRLIELWVSMGRIFVPWFAKFPPIQPDIVFKNEFDLKDFGVNGKVLHTPGHTVGSTTVVIEGKHAIAGDTFYGVKGMSTIPPFVDDKKEMIQSWKNLIESGIEYIYPGHGGHYTIDRVMPEFEQKKKEYKF